MTLFSLLTLTRHLEKRTRDRVATGSCTSLAAHSINHENSGGGIAQKCPFATTGLHLTIGVEEQTDNAGGKGKTSVYFPVCFFKEPLKGCHSGKPGTRRRISIQAIIHELEIVGSLPIDDSFHHFYRFMNSPFRLDRKPFAMYLIHLAEA